MKKVKSYDQLNQGYILCRFDECLLIDPPDNIEEIEEQLGEKTLKGILLTHAHYSHTQMIHYYKVPIYLHTQDAHLLFEDKYNGYYHKKRAYHRKDLELILIENQTKIPLADQVVTCYNTPGHTKGSMTYLYQNYLFTGDTLYENNVGRYDRYSGSLFDLKESIKKILETFPSHIKICPGHGNLSSIKKELKNNPYYRKWRR